MNRSDEPYRKCKECEGLQDCPFPEFDIEGKQHYPKYCPKAEIKVEE
jgi:hypothetical protein